MIILILHHSLNFVCGLLARRDCLISVLCLWCYKVAAKMKPLLDKYQLAQRTFAYVMDGGTNLSSTARFLEEGAEDVSGVCCAAAGSAAPLRQKFIAHAINNACNGSVQVSCYPHQHPAELLVIPPLNMCEMTTLN